MKKSGRFLLFFIVWLPLLSTTAFLGYYFLVHRAAPGPPIPAEHGRFAKPKKIQGFAVIKIDGDHASDLAVPLLQIWSSKHGRPVCFLPAGTRVKLLKKWWSKHERRHFYKLSTGKCIGWVPGESLVLENDQVGEADAREAGDSD